MNPSRNPTGLSPRHTCILRVKTLRASNKRMKAAFAEVFAARFAGPNSFRPACLPRDGDLRMVDLPFDSNELAFPTLPLKVPERSY